MAQEIEAVCRQRPSCFPPQVCRFCFGYPISAVVAGLDGAGQQTPLDVPDESVDEVREWLKAEAAA